MTEKVKIVITDDHRVFREGLLSLLEEFPSFETVGEASNGAELLQLLKTVKTDVIILDIHMPVLDGDAAFKIIKQLYPEVKIVILSMLDEAAIIASFIKMGVNAFLSKSAGIEEIVKTIENVINHEFYFDERVTEILQENLKKTKVRNTFNLSNRQLEVLEMICAGCTHKVIADKLGIVPRTVDYHKANIYKKTKVKSNAELAKLAVINRLLKLNKNDASWTQPPKL